MKHTPTHTEIGREYLRNHGKDHIFTRGQWHLYKDGYWNPLADAVMDKEVWQLLESYENKKMVRPTLGVHSSVIAYLQAEMFVHEKAMDAREELVCLRNGVYNMELNELISHKPEYYITTQLNFDYDPRATCPNFEFFLNTSFVDRRWTTDRELIAFVQEAVGYSLTTDVERHVTFFCLGEGANGKGTLFHVLMNLAGSAATALDINILRKEKYQLANLAGKRLALCGEANATDNLVDDGTLKMLIGGDAMTVRQIRREPFVLYPKAKLWWSMNRLPPVADTSRGFWRRIRVVPFRRQFSESERIYDLKERLDAELPGIFLWAVRGLQRLKLRGDFEIPSQVREETDEYMKESNVVQLFVEETCEVGRGNAVLSSVLYENYKRWCSDNGFKPFSVRSFKRELEALRFYSVRQAQGMYINGVRIKI